MGHIQTAGTFSNAVYLSTFELLLPGNTAGTYFMANDDKLDELVNIVKHISKIYDGEGIRIEIDFDYNDGMILIKYQGANAEQKTCIINANNKTVSGIDTTKFWMPDYSHEQTANKKLLQFMQTHGYAPSNIVYRMREKKK